MLASSRDLDGLLQKISHPSFVVWTFGKPRFYAYKSTKSFYKYMMTLSTVDRNFCETIRDCHQKPRLDIDIKKKSLPVMMTPEDIISEICYTILSAYTDITTSDIRIYNSNSTNAEKYSYHIIIVTRYHNDSKEAKQFYDTIKERLPRNLHDFIDSSVYKPMQQFRMLGNTKTDSYRPKVLQYSWKYFEEIVKVVPMTPLDEFRESLLSFTKQCTHLTPKYSTIDTKQAEYELKNNLASYEGVDMDKLMDLVPKGYQLNLFAGLKPYGYHLQRISPSECLICHRWHGEDSQGDNGRIFIRDNGIYFSCFRAGEGNKYLLDSIIKPKSYLSAQEKLLELKNKGIHTLSAEKLSIPKKRVTLDLLSIFDEGINKKIASK